MRKRLALVFGGVALAWLMYAQSMFSRDAEPPPDPDDTDALPLTAATEPPAPVAVAPQTPSAPVVVIRTAEPPPSSDAPVQQPPSDEVIERLKERPVKFLAAFESEPRDAFWANEQEPNLKQMLAAVEFTPEEFTDVACRRTVCRITFKQPRVSENRAIALYARVLTGFGDAQLVLHDADSDQPGQLYVLRKDYTLEAPSKR